MQTPDVHGLPCWYELSTGDLAAAGDFYRSVLGWSIADSGMEGITYHLATADDGGLVAGIASIAGQDGAPPPNWLVYFATDDCDGTVAATRDAGGQVFMGPDDIPGTGRFAVLADPQGAAFGVLQPLPMEDGSAGGRAFDQRAAGHGNWHELMTTDPVAGFDFYASLFGWTRGEAMDLGEMGAYQLVRRGDADIGGVMGLGPSPVPFWLPYFGANGVEEAIRRITAGGGDLRMGPHEVPGGAFIAVATDPQGAAFAVVGPRTYTP